jgi:DNA-binding response OmpR family regulator
LIPIKRILLVDDESGILQTLRIILTADGYVVETAWSSKEALGIVKNERFDLVVTDFNMPGMKGDELALHIKEHWPGTPVVMLSGSAEILRDCGRELSGVDILIDKPFNTTEFRREIVRLLAKNAVPANPAGMET